MGLDKVARILTILGQQVVCPPDNKRLYAPTEFTEFSNTGLFLLIRRIRISAADNCVLKILAELVLGAKVVFVGKVEKRKVLR